MSNVYCAKPVPKKKYSRALNNCQKVRSLSEPSFINYFSTLSTPLSDSFISTNGISLISNQEEFYTEVLLLLIKNIYVY